MSHLEEIQSKARCHVWSYTRRLRQIQHRDLAGLPPREDQQTPLTGRPSSLNFFSFCWLFAELPLLPLICQGYYPVYLIQIINPFSKNLILLSIYNLSSVQQTLNNRNLVFNSISSWRTERIKTSIGLVSIPSPRALGDSGNHKMNSHPGTAVPRNKQTSGPNRLLKVIDGFTITVINSWKHPHIFINHLLKTGNVLRA